MSYSFTPRELRRHHGISLITAAVGAGVSETTVRVYEIDPAEVKSVAKRRALDAYYATLAAADAPTERAPR